MKTIRTTKLMLASSALALAMTITKPAAAQQTGGNVVAGSASIEQNGAATTVTQTSDRAIVNWQRFDIGREGSVRFDQPGRESVILNRVLGAGASQIDGSLTANGRVFIVNQDGVMFGAGARVNVGGLTVSTADIGDADFMGGSERFDGPVGKGRIVNAGSITAREGGLVSFIGRDIANSGTITARAGTVTLEGRTTYTVDLAGDGLLSFDTGVAAPQRGSGLVELDVRAAQRIVSDVVGSTLDHAEPAIATAANGSSVALTGGSIDVSAAEGSGASGGSVVIRSDNAAIGPDARLSANGDGAGDGGRVDLIARGAMDFAGTITARSNLHWAASMQQGRAAQAPGCSIQRTLWSMRRARRRLWPRCARAPMSRSTPAGQGPTRATSRSMPRS
jgi:filamentous hemagglutinin family protein